MANLSTWLNEMCEGIIEAAENAESGEASNEAIGLHLRDIYTQMVRVSERTDYDTELVDWADIANEYGDDLGLDLVEAHQVFMDHTPQGSPHLSEPEAISHAEGLKRIPRDREVKIWIGPIYLNRKDIGQ